MLDGPYTLLGRLTAEGVDTSGIRGDVLSEGDGFESVDGDASLEGECISLDCDGLIIVDDGDPLDDKGDTSSEAGDPLDDTDTTLYGEGIVVGDVLFDGTDILVDIKEGVTIRGVGRGRLSVDDGLFISIDEGTSL
jgi:hypothetical protein